MTNQRRVALCAGWLRLLAGDHGVRRLQRRNAHADHPLLNFRRPLFCRSLSEILNLPDILRVNKVLYADQSPVWRRNCPTYFGITGLQ
jgi:hypothetical protein